MGTYIQRTTSSAGNDRTFTFATWLKRSVCTGANQTIFYSKDDNQNYIRLYFDSYERLQLRVYISNALNTKLVTKKYFVDVGAFYHIVWRCDTTDGTSGNRNRFYVNGTQLTEFNTETQPGQNTDYPINNSSTLYELGNEAYAQGEQFQGYLSQSIFADGQSYAASTFGSTNANGEWIPNASPSVTYGTNGFKIDYTGTGATADSNGFGADTSGNNNHFAATNLGTNPNVTDTPENNFCTLDSRQGIFVSSNTFSEGNTKIVTDGSQSYCFVNGTMGFGAGKWYWEMKAIAKSGGSDWYGTGVMVSPPTTSTDYGGGDVGDSGASGCYYYGYGQIRVNGATPNTYAAYTAGDIVSVAMDCDNEAIYFAKNGVWQNSGVPTSGSSTTGGQGVTDPYVRSAGLMFWVPGVCGFDGGQDYTMQVNFGNPPFAISSENADANGYGKFEYAVPSGYYAVCSKNIGQYG